jgi:hypothetical protein
MSCCGSIIHCECFKNEPTCSICSNVVDKKQENSSLNMRCDFHFFLQCILDYKFHKNNHLTFFVIDENIFSIFYFYILDYAFSTNNGRTKKEIKYSL